MIYKPLNDFMIESKLKNMAWDGILLEWLKKNYPSITLNNDSNLWETIKKLDNVLEVYEQIKFFLNEEITREDNIERLRNLVCINCFGINIETTDYLIEEMESHLDIFSYDEKKLYNDMYLISSESNLELLLSYNNRLEKTSIPVISLIASTLRAYYRRLLANCINIPVAKFDKDSRGIRIHYLNDQKFQFVVGVVSCGKINSANLYSKKLGLKSYLKDLRNYSSSNPGILSANLINNEYIGLFNEGDVIFGYEYLPIKKILGMNTGDCFKKHDKKLILDDLFFDTPSELIKHVNSNAVEIIIDMQPEAILPSYIVSIDTIKENDVLAAKILNLPIYVINSQICYENRIKKENSLIKGLKDLSGKNYLSGLIELYKYQEQTYMINTGYFSKCRNESVSRLDLTYKMVGKTIKEFYNSCVLDENLSIRKRLNNMESLMYLNSVIADVSLANSVSNKRRGDTKDFKCFFTEYESHSEFMNSVIAKIENKFNTNISIYSLIYLGSLICNVQDYNLKICYQEFSNQACEYLSYFKFPYVNLVKKKVFSEILDYSNIRIYDKNRISIVFDDDRLCVFIKDNIQYSVVFKTNNNSKFNKVKCSYVCVDENGNEIELRILKNGNLKIISDKKINILSNELKELTNEEYVINK